MSTKTVIAKKIRLTDEGANWASNSVVRSFKHLYLGVISVPNIHAYKSSIDKIQLSSGR